jgi:hypothetical protein
MAEERVRIIGGGVCGVRAWVDVALTVGVKKSGIDEEAKMILQAEVSSRELLEWLRSIAMRL